MKNKLINDLKLNKYFHGSLSGWRNRANKKGMEFNLTVDFLMDLYILQKGLCSLTGWFMTLDAPAMCNQIREAISIDRIDSRTGYIRGNVQLVCWQVNIAKHDLTSECFMNLCKSVIKWQKPSFGKLKVVAFK